MRIASKPALLTVPVVMFITLVAVLALWANGNIGAKGIGGSSSTASAVWNVEYWHRNADGDLLQYVKDHNAVTVEGIDAANLLLIDEGATLASGNPTTDSDTFDQILLMDVNLATRAITAPPQNSDILLLVDGGDDGNNSGQDTDAVHTNPADGLDAATGGGSGDGTVTVQFLAVGDPDAALQMRLVKAPPDDTASCCGAITLAQTLAVIAINVDLADTDTLTVTWTLNLNNS